MGSWLKFLAVSVFLFMLIQFSVPWVTATNGDAVPSGIVEAEETLVSAYDAVLEAEDAGANVSSLLDRLSVGGEYLAEAYNYFRLGDSENAGRLAGLCVEAVDDVEAEAVLLRDETVRLEKEDFLVNVFGSAVGVFIVVVSGFVLWEIFKRRYYAKVLDSKPEVISGEA
ncbi:MAG: hypothetical protein PVH73_01795 [Candidatus Bathyarchaeota archaeon]|jgi:hypothetical protein